MSYSALLTDLYQLTMLAGYYEKGMQDDFAVFDLFFRTPPLQRGVCRFRRPRPCPSLSIRASVYR